AIKRDGADIISPPCVSTPREDAARTESTSGALKRKTLSLSGGFGLIRSFISLPKRGVSNHDRLHYPIHQSPRLLLPRGDSSRGGVLLLQPFPGPPFTTGV